MPWLRATLLLAVLLAVLLAAPPARAEYDLTGVIDFHAHSDPDSVPRSLDALELARIARQRGLRGLVLKNHWEPTASLAYLARTQAPGLEAFGGIVLNRAVGGINPEAVERMVRTRGGFGRVVWLPTFDAAAIPALRAGQPLPELARVLAIVAREGLVLESGHYPPATALALLRAARDAGVRALVATHAMSPLVGMSIAEQKEAAALGAVIEHVYAATLPSAPLPGTRGAAAAASARQTVSMDDYARAIRAVGPEHCILTSDLGQRGNPIHPDGLLAFAHALLERGVTARELDLMLKTNPARLLGLPEQPAAVGSR